MELHFSSPTAEQAGLEGFGGIDLPASGSQPIFYNHLQSIYIDSKMQMDHEASDFCAFLSTGI